MQTQRIRVPDTGLHAGMLPHWQHGDLFPAAVIEAAGEVYVDWLPLRTPVVRYCVTCERPHMEASVTGIDGRFQGIFVDLKIQIGDCLDCQQRERESRLTESVEQARGTDYVLDLHNFPKKIEMRHFGFSFGEYPEAAWQEYTKTGRLYLWGKSGKGKTTIASAIARRVLQYKFESRRLGGSPYWLYAKSFYGMDLDQAKMAVSDAIAAHLLIVDDLFSATDDKAARVALASPMPYQAHMFAILDARYRDDKPTIVTCGLPLKSLGQYLGDSLYRRLMEGADNGNFKHIEVTR